VTQRKNAGRVDMPILLIILAAMVAAFAMVPSAVSLAQVRHQNAVIDLWAENKPAFGIFVPTENAPQASPGALSSTPPSRGVYTRERAEMLAANPLYDFVFLDLESAYDSAAINVTVLGLRGTNAVSRKTLIVRIPPIDVDGVGAARARVTEALELGADGVTIPHVRNVEQARQAVGFFAEAKANVWSPENPRGETLAMLIVEDPGAVAQAKEIAELKGYSILACGFGSLMQALGGNREAAEAATQKVLQETRRNGLVNLIPANAQAIERRVKEGFLALVAFGEETDRTIVLGRAIARR
jgi:2-keto-3-deoxy-L-rhamnonate aldolase RhmA